MKQRISIQLLESTEAKWNKMKLLHLHIADLAEAFDVKLSDLIWDDINHTKCVTYECYNMQKFATLSHECKSCIDGQNLKVEFISSVDVSGVHEIISNLKIATSRKLDIIN